MFNGRWAICMATCMTATVVGQAHLSSPSPQGPRLITTLSPTVLRTLSFGQPGLLADILYLQAVALWGQRDLNPMAYQDLAPLLQQVIALDRSLEGAYLLAGTALTLNGMPKHAGLELLSQGAALFPNNWRLQFLYGFNAYDLMHDTASAARALTHAATLEGAPAHLPMLAASISAQAHSYDLGIAMLQTLSQQTDDEDELRRYQQRIEALQRKKSARQTTERP